ncbi:MAG: STAS domain-containing protein [Actinomycetota bacterium]
MAEELEIVLTDDGTHLVRGDLDAHSAEAFEAAMAEVEGTVRLDLSAVDFADSSGLRVLLGLHRRLDDDGGELRIRSAGTRLRRLLSLTGLDQVLALD